MTPAKQLPLTVESPEPSPDILGDAKGFWFSSKEDRDPIKRAHIVIGKYVGRYGRQPNWLTCAPAEAAVIGREVLGVRVYEANTNQACYRVGMKKEV